MSKTSKQTWPLPAVNVDRLVRRGWRTFLCDECGHHYEASTRDAISLSGDTCPECNELNFPTEYRIDAEIPCDDYGNLMGYQINAFPTNTEISDT